MEGDLFSVIPKQKVDYGLSPNDIFKCVKNNPNKKYILASGVSGKVIPGATIKLFKKSYTFLKVNNEDTKAP